MLMEPSEQEGAFELIGNTYTCQRMGDKSHQNPKTFYFSEILRSSGMWGMQRDAPSKVHLAPPTKNEAQHLVDLFGFWRQHIPHLSVFLRTMYQVTRKAASFVWAWNTRRLFSRSRLLGRLLYHSEHMNQQTPWYLRCQWQIGMLSGAFGWPL